MRSISENAFPAAEGEARETSRRSKMKKKIFITISYLVLAILSLFFLFPFIVMVCLSVLPDSEINLLQSGLVPCVQSGKKTRNYTIKMKDIVRYLERREIHPEKYKLPPGSYSGTYAVKPLLPESVTTEELRKYYIESFRDIPDIVSTREAAELTGATASTVAKWIRTKKLKALSHGPAFIIPKVNLIDFMASDAYLNKRLKSQKFHENIGGFLSWKAGK